MLHNQCIIINASFISASLTYEALVYGEILSLCYAGERQQDIEAHCQRLRLLYRDCAKPPVPPSPVTTIAVSRHHSTPSQQISLKLTAWMLLPDSVIVQNGKIRYLSESILCLIRKLSWTSLPLRQANYRCHVIAIVRPAVTQLCHQGSC